MQVQPSRYGDYRAEIRVYDELEGWSDWMVRGGGVSSDHADGSALFIGVTNDQGAASFTMFEVRAFMSLYPHDAPFYASTPQTLGPLLASSVPEPASFAVLGLGAVALVRGKRRR